MKFLKKLKGRSQSPPRVSLYEILWSWFGAFSGIALIAWLNQSFSSGGEDLFIIGSFGASAVLLYGAVRSPLAQPRNFLGGHIISAFIGVSCFKLFGNHLWLASALAVATAIAAMHATKTLHPPGGANALIAVIGGENIHSLGYKYVLFPVSSGALIMLVVALLVNNIARKRRYPEFWF